MVNKKIPERSVFRRIPAGPAGAGTAPRLPRFIRPDVPDGDDRQSPALWSAARAQGGNYALPLQRQNKADGSGGNSPGSRYGSTFLPVSFL